MFLDVTSGRAKSYPFTLKLCMKFTLMDVSFHVSCGVVWLVDCWCMLNIQFETKSPADKKKQETVIPWESSRFWTASRCKKKIELQILMLFRPNESCKRHVSVARFRSAFLELHIFAVFVRVEAAQYMLQQKISSLFSFLSHENKRK